MFLPRNDPLDSYVSSGLVQPPTRKCVGVSVSPWGSDERVARDDDMFRS